MTLSNACRLMYSLFLCIALGFGGIYACSTVSSDPVELGAPRVPESVVLESTPTSAPPSLPPQAPQEDYRIIETSPQRRTRGGSQLRVRFSRPVVALLDAQGEVDQARGLFTIEPPVAGSARWVAPDLLVFNPQSNWPSATHIRVTLNTPIKTLDGTTFQPNLSWSFETDRPSVIDLSPSDASREVLPDTSVELDLTHDATLQEITKHVKVFAQREGKERRALSVRVAAYDTKRRNVPSSLFVIRPRSGRWPTNAQITVALPKGWTSATGPLPALEDWSASFNTISALKMNVACEDAEGLCSYGMARVHFTHPVPSRYVRMLRVHPKPENFRVTSPWSSGSAPSGEVTSAVLMGAFKRGETYTVYAPAQLRDVYRQPLQTSTEASFTVQFPKASLHLGESSGILHPDTRAHVGFDSRHVRKVKIRVASLSKDDVMKSFQKGLFPLSSDPKQPLPTFPKDTTQTLVQTLDTKGETHWASTSLDLQHITGVSRGVILLSVEPVEMFEGHATPDPVYGMYRLTDLGVDIHTSSLLSGAQVSSLATLQPKPRASVRWFSSSGTKTIDTESDVHGLVSLPYTTTWATQGDHALSEDLYALVESEDGSDWTVLRAGDNPAQGAKREGSLALRQSESMRGILLADRGVYRPGDVVHTVGWAVVETPFTPSGTRTVPVGTEVSWRLTNRRNEEVAIAKSVVLEGGKMTTSLTLPTNAKLGAYRITAHLFGEEIHSRSTLNVEEFRDPPFRVNVSVPSPDIVQEPTLELLTTARYYFGAPVSFKSHKISLNCSHTAWRPDALASTWDVGLPVSSGRYASSTGKFEGLVGSKKGDRPQGAARMQIDLSGYVSAHAQRCMLYASVRDMSYQTVSAETSFVLHPAPVLIALERLGRAYLGDKPVLNVRAVDLEGQPSALSSTSLKIERVERVRSPKRGWKSRKILVKNCTLDLEKGKSSSCPLPILFKEGDYTVSASAVLDGREIRTETSFFVTKQRRIEKPQTPRVDPSTVPRKRFEVVLDPTSAAPGERVNITIQAPPDATHGVLHVVSGGIQRTDPFVFKDGVAKFSMVVEEAWVSRVKFEASTRILKGRPRSQTTRAILDVSSENRTLRVSMESPKRVGPRDTSDILVRVRNAQGEEAPERTRVAIWAVDESALSLSKYTLPNIARTFLFNRSIHLNRRNNFLDTIHPFSPTEEDPLLSESSGLGGFGSGRGYGGSGGKLSMRERYFPNNIPGDSHRHVRDRFETTPLFLGDAPVRDGVATIPVTWSDTLSTFRIFAVASQTLGDSEGLGRFGHAETSVRVTAPLVIQSALPKFLRAGDEAELATVITNRTKQAGRIAVSMDFARGQERIQVLSAVEQSGEMDAHGSKRFAFRVRALENGPISVEIRATLSPKESPPLQDAARYTLDVRKEPTQIEQNAFYTTLSDATPKAISLHIPAGISPHTGGVSIDASPTLLAGLQDSIDALIHYPYGCAEQTSSRLLPLIALKEFSAPETTTLKIPNLERFTQAGVDRLLSMQTADGGFSYWPGGTKSLPYTSAYVTWILWSASKQGAQISPKRLTRALGYLESFLRKYKPSSINYARAAIALYTLIEAGRMPKEALDAMLQRVQTLPGFARGFLALALHKTNPSDPRLAPLRALLVSDLVEDASSAHVRTRPQYNLSSIFHSNTREDAIVLLALLSVAPKHPVVPKIARHLLDARRKGTWRNTQENAYALLALSQYARVYEAEPSDFTLNAWIHEQPVLHTTWTPKRDQPINHHVDVSQKTLDSIRSLDPERTRDKPAQVTLQRKGTGRAYVRVGYTFAREGFDLPEAHRNLSLRRSLRTAQGSAPDDVTLQAGELVALDIVLGAQTQNTYVAVDIPIPTGLEAIQRSLGTGVRAIGLKGHQGYWVSREELRKDRVLLFADFLPAGQHVHTVFLRATTAGSFALPSAVALNMYKPEHFARTSGGRVRVVAP